MTYQIVHRTEYRYSRQVARSVHVTHLRPRSLPGQELTHFSLNLHPTAVERSLRRDYFGNWVDSFAIEGLHGVLQIEGVSQVVLAPAGQASPSTGAWEQVSERILQDHSMTGLRVREFLSDTPQTPRLPALIDYARLSFAPDRPFLEAVRDLMARIHSDYQFDPTATTVSTPLERVIDQRRGVCQDFAHLMVACLRSVRLPARYVSGYLRTVPPPGQARLTGVDASHAWVSVFSPETGWLSLDPTNNRIAGQDYVVLGWGREYSDVSLIRGVLDGGGEHDLLFSVDVTPVSATA